MTALIDRVGDTVDAIDVFCGFGGSSQGIHAAGATVLAAANHSELSIECHATNFPDTDHWQADLADANDPKVMNRAGKMVPGRYLDPADLPRARFAWFSPSCTHHSQANAKKIYEKGRQASFFDIVDDDPAHLNSERSRVTMSCVLKYAAKNLPEIIVTENVTDVCHWGPGRDGSTYRWWLSELALLGYEIKECFFNSMFFPPCPQSRDRVYIVAWRKGNTAPDLDYRPTAYCMSDRCGGKIVQARQVWRRTKPSWPRPRWGKHGKQYDYVCPTCTRVVEPAAWPAYTAIDWSDLGPMISERESIGMQPLADATMERIRRGLAKFRGSPPIVIPAKGVWGVDRPVTEPFTTQTSQQDKALATSFLVKNNGPITDAGYRAVPITGPLGSTTCHPTQSLATAGVVPIRTHGTPAELLDQLRTVVSGTVGQAVVSEGITLAAAGHTSERPGQTRARDWNDPLFTQHTTQAFGFAHLPYIVEMRGGGSVEAGQHPVTDPMHGVTAGGMHHGLTSPAIFAKINGGPGDTAWHSLDDSLNTITSRDTTGLVILPWVDQWQSDPAAVTEQLATVMTRMRHSLASVEAEPLDAITLEDLQQVRFRMLNPDPELRRAMAFGATYILLGNKSQMTAGLGNAVTPPVASWITMRCLATLGGGTTNQRKAA